MRPARPATHPRIGGVCSPAMTTEPQETTKLHGGRLVARRLKAHGVTMLCALSAGPGVTNGISALGSALQNHSPMLVLGGRAPAMRWGQGSLQEIDHVPFVRPLVKLAATASSTAEIPALVDDAWATALRPHSGPAFVDFPF